MKRIFLTAVFALGFAACSGSGAGDASSGSGAGGASASSTGVMEGSSTGAGAGGAGGGSGAGGSVMASGTIVPLYTYPTDVSWTALAAAKKNHPSVLVEAIINPDSGPGASSDPAYATGIATLDAAGVVVLAYVATTYAKKPAASAQAEINTYLGYYPNIRGIFFDEMSNTPGDEAYYSSLNQYAKGKGLISTVGNPGTNTEESFVGTVDTILIYESGGLPDLATFAGFVSLHDKKNFGIIPYGVPALDAAFVAAARERVGFTYLTDDSLPNPWDSLPPYFDALLGALE